MCYSLLPRRSGGFARESIEWEFPILCYGYFDVTVRMCFVSNMFSLFFVSERQWHSMGQKENVIMYPMVV